jgi:hypothetical protein
MLLQAVDMQERKGLDNGSLERRGWVPRHRQAVPVGPPAYSWQATATVATVRRQQTPGSAKLHQ